MNTTTQQGPKEANGQTGLDVGQRRVAPPASASQSTGVEPSNEARSIKPTARRKASWSEDLTVDMVAKQEAFYKVNVHHRVMDSLLDDLMPLLMPHSESNIIVVTGATGAGKSTLTRVLLKSLFADFASLMDADKTTIPLIAVEAYSSGETNHGFKGLFRSMAEQLEEPALQSKTPTFLQDGKLKIQPSARHTIEGLRRIVQDGLKARQTRVAVIDEAAHLLRFAKSAVAMDTLKSLSNTAGGVKWVLVGSFDLFDLISEGGQIARRSAILNLGRYHLSVDEDRNEFKRIVSLLQAKWPSPEEVPNFVAVSDELLEISLGCIGLLKSLMLDASAMQLRNKGRWKGEFLRKAAKANKLRSLIERETQMGEAKVRDALYGNCHWDDDTFGKILQKMNVGHG